MPQVGDRVPNPKNPNEEGVWTGSEWVIGPKGFTPPGAGATGGGRLRPDIGPNARELEDGSIVSTGRNGGLQIIRGSSLPTLGADSAPRIYAGMDAAVEANAALAAGEAQSRDRAGGLIGGALGLPGSGNPLSDDWLADMVRDSDKGAPGMATAVAKGMGGDSWQLYDRASGSFETAVLPILSGAAVSPTEAQRMVRAALPARGDSPATLAAKERQRKMMLNGLATIARRPPPYPEVPSMFRPDGSLAANGAAPPPPAGQPSPRIGRVAAGAVGGVGALTGGGLRNRSDEGPRPSPGPATPPGARAFATLPPATQNDIRRAGEGGSVTRANGEQWGIRGGQPRRLR